jgi:hypothetical protein
MGLNKVIGLSLVLAVVQLFAMGQSQLDQNINDSDIRKIFVDVQQENARLRKLVEILIERDIESDIFDIKRTLTSHAEDITNLRINQGLLEDTDAEQDSQISVLQENVLENANQLCNHQEQLDNHQLLIDSQSSYISNHEELLSSHTTQIQSNLNGVNSNAAKIEEDRADINLNLAGITSLIDNYNTFQSSLVRFHVESPCCQGFSEWPDNSRITFENKLVDTHNTHDGNYYSAPMTGFYGFIFTADIRYYDYRSDPGVIYVRVNDGNVKGYLLDLDGDLTNQHPSSIFFVLSLNQGDRVDLVTSDSPVFDVIRNGASLSGFLLQKQ